MEEQAAALLATLRKPSTTTEAKLALFNNLKSNIKHLRVPESAQATIFECVRAAIGSQTSSSLVSAGFATLGHLIKRLSLQNQDAVIASQGSKLFQILLDRLGDARESHRNAASQALSDLWPYNPTEVERLIREGALAGMNARAKDMAMLWVVKMSKDEGLQFRSFVSNLVACLEDADGMVRETAKSSVVELFRNAPDHAKADLKKQMNNHNVRKTISAHVLSQLAPSPPPPVEPDLKASTMSAASTERLPDTNLAESMMSEQGPPVETVQMDPLYVHTQRELEEHFRDMLPHFEGKESEQNWQARDRSVLKLRRLTKGNAPTEMHAAFMAGIKSLLDGILKVVNSLRTTMSTQGCRLVQELARTVGPALDSMAEILLQNFIKMSANTKHISSQNGNETVDVIFSCVPYHSRLMQHVWLACQDKNVQPRIYAAGWLKTLITKHSSHKAQIEHSGGVELAEKCIKKGLADANPKVRESMRGCYWLFAQIWPEKAEAIMSTLDTKSKQLLEKDSNNPNAASLSSSVSSAMSAAPKSKSATTSARSSLKETIAAQKKAQLAARKMPERPTSALATFSPIRHHASTTSLNARAAPSGSSHSNRAPSAMSSSNTRPALQSSASASASSLMAAPVRRPRRVEIARPATADPYASRRAVKPETPSRSPAASPRRDFSTKSVASSKRVARTRPIDERSPAPTAGSPAVSPIKNKSRVELLQNEPLEPSSTDSSILSPSREENFTMVMPSGVTLPTQFHDHRPLHRSHMEPDHNTDNVATYGEDEGFTIVVPSVKPKLRPDSFVSPRQSPQKHASAQSHSLSQDLAITQHLTAENSRSPRVIVAERSPGIERSTERNQIHENGVKVYEDPFVDEEQSVQHATEPAKPVLEELTPNEQSLERGRSCPSADPPSGNAEQQSLDQDQPRSPSKALNNGNINGHSNGESNASTDRADLLRSRRLLASGIDRIRARTLDAHGFRRLQDLVKNSPEALEGSSKLSDLLLALLDYLEHFWPTPEPGKTTLAKTQSLKAQALVTTRALLNLYRKEATHLYPKALCAAVVAKAYAQPTSHVAAELDKLANEIIRVGNTTECIDAVLKLIPTAEEPSSSPDSSPSSTSSHLNSIPSARTAPVDDTGPSRATAAAVSTLSSLLRVTTASPRSTFALDSTRTQRLGHAATRCLSDANPDVRKAALDLCVELHERLGRDPAVFWKALAGIEDRHLNLITYYLARKAATTPVA